MSHFLAVRHDIDCDRVYGIYDTVQQAMTDLDNRTIDHRMTVDQARRNGPGSGPYSDDYGVDMADIEEWDGRRHVATWELDWSVERREWRNSWRANASIQG